jgi:hypothetical protein
MATSYMAYKGEGVGVLGDGGGGRLIEEDRWMDGNR